MVRRHRKPKIDPSHLLRNLQTITRFCEAGKQEALARSGMRADRYAILSHIAEHGTSLRDIGRSLRLPRYQLTRTAQWLKKQHLVGIRKSSGDGRIRELSLTERGVEKLAEIEQAIEDSLRKSLPGGVESKNRRSKIAAKLAHELVAELMQPTFLDD